MQAKAVREQDETGEEQETETGEVQETEMGGRQAEPAQPSQWKEEEMEQETGLQTKGTVKQHLLLQPSPRETSCAANCAAELG